MLLFLSIARFVGVAELEPFTITPYKPEVYVLFSKIGHPIGHLRVKFESFTAAKIPNGFDLTQTKTNNFKFNYPAYSQKQLKSR